MVSSSLSRELQWDIIPHKVRIHERRLVILIREYLVIRIRHLRNHALEHRLAHRIQLRGMVSVVILAAPYPREDVWLCFAEPSNVNEKPVPYINPPRIDDVHAIAAYALDHPGVDVKQVLALHLAVCRGVLVSRLIVRVTEAVESYI